MLRFLTQLFPRRIRKHFTALLVYSRFKVRQDTFLGLLSFIVLIVAVFLTLMISLLAHTNIFITFFVSFLVVSLFAYFTISIKADAVASFIENIFPDALQLMTSNLRAGLTTDQALLAAARPEFGPLSDDLNEIGKKLALGEDIGKSLIDMSHKVKSDNFKKTMLLIVSGLRSGGELVELLAQVGTNLRHGKFVEEKIRANVLMYNIFIFIAIGIGAPMLFGLSSFLISVLQQNLATIELPQSTAFPLTFSQITITPSFIIFFSIISLITTSVLGSLVLGLISKGQEKRGVKLIPILLALSLGIFFLSRFLIKTLLGGLFGI